MGKGERKQEGERLTLTVRQLAEMLGCPFEGDGEVRIRDVSSLEMAGEGDIVFLGQAKLRKKLEETRASAAIIPPGESFRRIPVLIAENPQLAFVRAVEIFFKPYRLEPGVHPSAQVAPTAKLGKDVAVGALSVVGDDAEIGEGTIIFPLVIIYPRVKIGEGAVIHSHVSIREGVRVGNRVIIHNGAVIGSDGFGYIKMENGSYRKIPQKGTVVIEDDVEIGANTAVDRAALGETLIRRGVKIDNLVQVAHNVEIGENAILTGQVGIAGSSRVGKNVVMGGQAGVADHVNVGDNATIAAQSGIHKDIPAGAIVAGTPHLDIREAAKIWALMPQLHDFVKDMKRLKARVEELEKLIKNKS
ncbi:MAG: UDP-3-O-(3-hydroxymyristoyl)glucosamine N-acyltransferase [Clostridiales bacterium]|nr:UDP-3-O-(3-hydroxymyristoyl)glucosamine N-acyltransferase [Clostridiales bacterium]